MSESEIKTADAKSSSGALAFQIFCALIFLGMIGMVFTNAVLRYAFNSGYPPSEEWARFFFIYITIFFHVFLLLIFFMFLSFIKNGVYKKKLMIHKFLLFEM